MHLETLELRDNVFVIPYDKSGFLSQTKRIELHSGAKVMIMRGRDKGTKGEVIGRNGYHFRMNWNYLLRRR